MFNDILRILNDTAHRIHMPSDETLRRFYREKHYFEDLTENPLLARGRDLFLNLMTIARNGKLIPLPRRSARIGTSGSALTNFLRVPNAVRPLSQRP